MEGVLRILTDSSRMVRGRIIQMTGTAALTAAVRLLALFQREQSGVVAYVSAGVSLPFPGDLSAGGVALEELLVVLPHNDSSRNAPGESSHLAGAAETLLRSRQCSCICLDYAGVSRAARAGELTPGVLARLMHQCRHTGTTLILLPGMDAAVLGPAVGLHLHTHAARQQEGGYLLTLEVRRSRIPLRSDQCHAVLPDRLC